MKFKKICTTILAGIMIFGNCCTNFIPSNAAIVSIENEDTVAGLVPQETVLEEEEQQIIDEIVDASEEEGVEAAALLNEVEDEKTYEYALKSALENLYTNDNSTVLDEFVNSLENNPIAEEIIESYETANAERENAENLEYDVNSVIIGYTPQTDDDYLKAVTEEQFGEVEEVFEVEENINTSNLAKEKIEQIENIKTEKKDTVAVIEISKGQTVQQAIEEYSQYANVEYVEPNYKIPIANTKLTYDTDSDDQYYLKNINIPDGWNAVNDFGFRQTLVAVIDTGAQMNHPDLKNVYFKNYCVDVTQTTNPKLENLTKQYTDHHGTSVAGIISAEANNNKGIAGVGTGADKEMARIMAIKCSTQEGYLDSAAMIKGIYYAVDHGADVINISAGSEYSSAAEEAAINYAYENGVIVVAAAGNEGSNQPHYPAAYNHVIAVAATQENNKKASFTSYGDWVDISAPGESIYTCDIGSDYWYYDGTSFSAPMVAGTVAIMKAYTCSQISFEKIEQILKSTATDIGVNGMGAGLINSGLAIQKTKYMSYKNEQDVITSIKPYNSKGTIKLRWRGNTYSEGFIVYRSTSKNGEYKKIKTITDHTITSYIDSGLKSGKTYYYKIRGYMNYNKGRKYCKYSTIKSAKTN